MTTLGAAVLRGAAAGAAGTTALNTLTYLDMAVRGRPASSTPETTVERMAQTVHVPIPGQGDTRQGRLQGLGGLTGILTGVGVGAAYGAVTAVVGRPPTWVSAGITSMLALVGANGGMVALGVSDPRTWSAADWAADLVPHVAYGAVTALTLDALR